MLALWAARAAAPVAALAAAAAVHKVRARDRPRPGARVAASPRHQNWVTHWAPRPVEADPWTACGLHTDRACDLHTAQGEGCTIGLCWTRDTSGPLVFDGKPPCPPCDRARAAVARPTGIEPATVTSVV